MHPAATTTYDAAPDLAFSASLREHTKAVHRAAERAGFIADLLHGRATPSGYTLFLRNLRLVYAALEGALEAEADDPLVRPFAAPGLRRLGALDADLRALDPRWADRPALPEARAYAAAVSGGGRAGVVAHAYARYLGDLSGGQILKPLLARALGLAPETLTFYEFPSYEDLATPKARLREALDTVPADGPLADRIRAEAVGAFQHTIALAEAVQAASAA